MNSLRNSDRKQLLSLLVSNRTIRRRAALSRPSDFRSQLCLPGETLVALDDVLQPWQRSDLQALDAAWSMLAGRTQDGSTSIRRAYIERPRGHSKTSDMAVQISWILLAAREPLTGLAAAADQEQARFLHDSMRRLQAANPELFESLQFLENLVRNRITGSRLEVISSDVKSSYGALPDFVVCDELSHWDKPEMWYSLLSSAAKKPQCVLTILTNAGVGQGWQWDVREHARRDRGWYFSSLDGPQAPWITDEWLAEQRALLPEPVFERLWLNRWQQAEGNFVTLNEAERCRDTGRRYQQNGQPGRFYVATLDYAEKHDDTVGCVCHREGETIVVDRMDVVRPTSQRPTTIAWVEDWIEDVGSRFDHVRFVVDEYQLIGTIQRLGRKYALERFAFRAGDGNHRLAVALRQLIVHRQVQWYPGCGEIRGPHRDDLETELASLILRHSSQGRLRIDHQNDGRHHDDRAFALGVACLTLKEQDVDEGMLVVTPPDGHGRFDW